MKAAGGRGVRAERLEGKLLARQPTMEQSESKCAWSGARSVGFAPRGVLRGLPQGLLAQTSDRPIGAHLIWRSEPA